MAAWSFNADIDEGAEVEIAVEAWTEVIEAVGEGMIALDDIGEISDGIHGRLRPNWEKGLGCLSTVEGKNTGQGFGWGDAAETNWDIAGSGTELAILCCSECSFTSENPKSEPASTSSGMISVVLIV